MQTERKQPPAEGASEQGKGTCGGLRIVSKEVAWLAVPCRGISCLGQHMDRTRIRLTVQPDSNVSLWVDRAELCIGSNDNTYAHEPK